MKNWTAMCQEMAYVRTGKVYFRGEWSATNDRGLAVGMMAMQRGELTRVLVRSMSMMASAFEKFRDSLPTLGEILSEWGREVVRLGMTVQKVPRNCNYAAAMLDSCGRHYRGYEGPIVHGVTT